MPVQSMKNKYSEPGHLKTHKQSHTGEKPFIGGSCQNKFHTSTLLNRNKRSHTGQKDDRGLLVSVQRKIPHTGDKASLDRCG